MISEPSADVCTAAESRAVRYARASLAQVRAAGVDALIERHYREIAHFKDIPLDLDWVVYQAAEEAGRLRIFTARAGVELVGYGAYIVTRNRHYKGSLQAIQDALFLAPERRGLLVGYQLIAFADRELAGEGVQVTYQHSKVAHPMDAVLKRQGYELVDTLWAKRLDGGSSPAEPR